MQEAREMPNGAADKPRKARKPQAFPALAAQGNRRQTMMLRSSE